MNPIIFTKSLATAVANAICASQSIAGAGNALINGTLASGGVATLDTARRVIVTSAANDSAITFRITGTNQSGNYLRQTIAGANAGVAVTTLDFKTVTEVYASGATAGAITVGTNTVGASPARLANNFPDVTNIAFATQVTGTVNYDIQYCIAADPAGIVTGVEPTNLVWISMPDQTAKTAATNSFWAVPISAWRLLINSGTGTVALTALQSG